MSLPLYNAITTFVDQMGRLVKQEETITPSELDLRCHALEMSLKQAIEASFAIEPDTTLVVLFRNFCQAPRSNIGNASHLPSICYSMFSDYAKKKITFSESSIERLIPCITHALENRYDLFFPYRRLLGFIEVFAQTHDLSKLMKKDLLVLQKRVMDESLEIGKQLRVILSERIQELLKDASDPHRVSIIFAEDCEWTTSFRTIFATFSNDTQILWGSLWKEVRLSSSSLPSKGIVKSISASQNFIARDVLLHQIATLLSSFLEVFQEKNVFTEEEKQELADTMSDEYHKAGYTKERYLRLVLAQHKYVYISDEACDVIRLCLWMLLAFKDYSLIKEYVLLAQMCAEKIAGVGPRNIKLFRAVVALLKQDASHHAIYSLSQLVQKVRYPSLLLDVHKALTTIAKVQGIEECLLQDMVVPSFEMNKDGIIELSFDEVRGKLLLTQSFTVQETWEDQEGITHKSSPVFLQELFPDDMKDFKKIKKELKNSVALQRNRFQAWYDTHRCLSGSDFAEYFLSHPLLSRLADGLLFVLNTPQNTTTVILSHGKFHTLSGVQVPLESNAVLFLWHPVSASFEEKKEWEKILKKESKKQIFPQLEREVFAPRDLPTFLGKILDQHLFYALLRECRWSVEKFSSFFDTFTMPTKNFPGYQISVSLSVEPVNHPHIASLPASFVRITAIDFFDSTTHTTIPFDSVPSLLLSETLRDISLVVVKGGLKAVEEEEKAKV